MNLPQKGISWNAAINKLTFYKFITCGFWRALAVECSSYRNAVVVTLRAYLSVRVAECAIRAGA